MTRIFIENEELDLTADITQSITYAIDDIVNLDSKSTSFTKTIVIPGTNRNNILFGNIFDFGNANFTAPGNNVFYNFDASRSAKARIEINGLEAMRGILRLMRIVHDRGAVEYEIALFGELGGLISAIGNKRLEDIDFSAYNHQWTAANITNSWEPEIEYVIASDTDFITIGKRIIIDELINFLAIGDFFSVTGTSQNNTTFSVRSIVYDTANEITTIYVNEFPTNETNVNGYTITLIQEAPTLGYVYPLINYGNVTDDVNGTRYLDWQFKAFRPAFFVKEYIDRILSEAGYTYDSKFFNTNFFKRLIIPNNDIALQKIGESSFYIQADTQETISGTITSIVTNNIAFDNRTLTNFSYSSNKFTYTAISSNSIAFNLKISGTISRSVDFGGFVLALTKNGQVLSNAEIQIDGQYIEFETEINYTGQIFPNDIIELKYTITGTPVLLNVWNINVNAVMVAEAYPKGFVNYNYNDMLNMNHLTPKNVYQRDFFTSILKLFNLMVVEDKQIERRLIIEPDATFYNTDRSTFLDWSDKVDRSQPISIQPMSEANARYYQLTYKPDNDFYNEEYKKKFNENYGDRIFDNQLEFAKSTQKVEVIFSSSVLTGFSGEIKVFPTICKISNDEEEPIAHNIRIMQCKLIKDVPEYDILNDSTVLDSVTSYMYAGHFNDPDFPTSDLNFGATRQLYFNLTEGSLQNNMFNAFYSPYMAEITDKDSRLVTFTMKLSEIDIFQLDWRRFIYIDGVLYRLKKIIDWAADNVCKVELLRALNTTYISEMIYFNTVKIGDQIWAAQNLYTKYYNNGDPIPFAANDSEWQDYQNLGVGCYAYKDYSSHGGQYDSPTYGLYYNYLAIKDDRGIAPRGWKVPSKTDFEVLKNNYTGGELKLPGEVFWSVGNISDNATGFSAQGLGYTDGNVFFQSVGDLGLWWTNTRTGINYYAFQLEAANDDVSILDFSVDYGFNIRLIKI